VVGAGAGVGVGRTGVGQVEDIKWLTSIKSRQKRHCGWHTHTITLGVL